MSRAGFAGRHGLVTGGGSGIGQGAAVALARAGADVTLVGRHARSLEQTAELVRDAGAAAIVAVADVRDERALEAAVEAAWKHSPVDLLVASAATNAPGPLVEADPATLRTMVDVNVTGTLLACRAFGRRLLAEDRPGAVVCVSSQMGAVGFPGRVTYCAAKHAVNGLTKALALEWAAHGVRVNAVAPTFVETPLTAPMFADPAFHAEVISRIPQGRLGTVTEVADAILYLLSDAASLITGHVLAADGGWTAI